MEFSTLDTVEFEENNRILLRKINFAFVIPNPSLDCYYVVFNFFPNLSLVLIKLFLLKKSVYDTSDKELLGGKRKADFVFRSPEVLVEED